MQEGQEVGGGALAAIGAALLAAPFVVRRLLNVLKAEKADSSVLDRLLAHEKRMNKMDRMISRQQKRITRLQVLVIQMEALLIANGIGVPEAIKEDIRALTADDDYPDDEDGK